MWQPWSSRRVFWVVAFEMQKSKKVLPTQCGTLIPPPPTSWQGLSSTCLLSSCAGMTSAPPGCPGCCSHHCDLWGGLPTLLSTFLHSSPGLAVYGTTLCHHLVAVSGTSRPCPSSYGWASILNPDCVDTNQSSKCTPLQNPRCHHPPTYLWVPLQLPNSEGYHLNLHASVGMHPLQFLIQNAADIILIFTATHNQDPLALWCQYGTSMPI